MGLIPSQQKLVELYRAPDKLREEIQDLIATFDVLLHSSTTYGKLALCGSGYLGVNQGLGVETLAAFFSCTKFLLVFH